MRGMQANLTPGARVELEIVVTPEMCPHFDGRLVHPVLSTWMTVHYMELAGRRLLVPHLDELHEGIGARITIEHKSPAPVGAKVRVCATIESWDGKNLVCTTQAVCGRRVVAEGRFVQVILTRARLAAVIARAQVPSDAQ